MKFIFDFDDVLFHSTKLFKEHMYARLEKAGIPRVLAEESYAKSKRSQVYWLKNILKDFLVDPDVYGEILNESKNFINIELLDLVQKLGKDNCYIVSYGNMEFQHDKIKKAGISSLFSEVVVVPDNKKEAVEKICAQFPHEKVLFIDDKAKHFENLDFAKYPNLKTVLYDKDGFKKVMAEINV